MAVGRRTGRDRLAYVIRMSGQEFQTKRNASAGKKAAEHRLPSTTRKPVGKKNRRLDSIESRDARAALPQNCSIDKVLWGVGLGNSTKVLAVSPGCAKALFGRGIRAVRLNREVFPFLRRYE